MNRPTHQPISEHEINKLLHEIAVKEGLSVPTTPEQVAWFEQHHAEAIQKAKINLPDLKEIKALAESVKTGKHRVFETIAKTPVDSQFQMAARNGLAISNETLDKMNAAVQKAKRDRE
jgi:hypothetical protein